MPKFDGQADLANVEGRMQSTVLGAADRAEVEGGRGLGALRGTDAGLGLAPRDERGWMDRTASRLCVRRFQVVIQVLLARADGRGDIASAA
jgi:hypothetical protein